jgi:hypothetical protein
LREDPSWRTYALDSGHNLMRDAPQDLLKILLQVVDPADGERDNPDDALMPHPTEYH